MCGMRRGLRDDVVGVGGRLGDGMVGVSGMSVCLGAPGLFDRIKFSLTGVDPDQHSAGCKSRPRSEA
jgi:hypothetical protein